MQSITTLISLTFIALIASLLPTVDARIQHIRQTSPSNLFPPSFNYTAGYTTASGVSIPGIEKVDLSDNALNVIRVASGFSRNVVSAAGRTAWQARFPKGSYKPEAQPRGGFGFYVGGSDEFAQQLKGGADHAIFAYSVMFQDGWQFNKGGKLPGAFGGVGDSAFSCSGGRQQGRDKCFDVRLMWRRGGMGEMYTYLPPTTKNTAALLSVPPLTILNTHYGNSVGRGSFTFPAGKWVSVAERVKLNDPGQNNGEVQVWFNGKSVMDVKGLMLRTSADSVLHGMHFQTFFGGSSPDFASPADQNAWFSDVSGAIITN